MTMTLEQLLARDGRLIYKISGISMEPMLRQNRDLVMIRVPEERLKKYDQKRERYYNTNTNKKWGSIDSYDMCLDSGKLGYNMCRDIIVKTVEMSE